VTTTYSELTDPAGTVAAGDNPATVEISIYDAIGGRPSLVAAVDDFYGRLLDDPVLGPNFHGNVAERHKRYVVTVLGEALGGPERYRGPDLAKAHSRLAITDAHFDRAAGHLAATLEGLGLPSRLVDRIVGIVATLRPLIVTA
jgi:hemoglobin